MINKTYLTRLGAVALAVSVAGGLTASAAQAQVFERALQGAIGGAVIGGATHGRHGVGKGAAIGAAAGVVIGAIEEEQHRKSHRRRAHRRATASTHSESSQDPLIYDTQAALSKLGYEPGPVDGVYGNQTSHAIGEYQKENGLLVTGSPSPALLAHMTKQGG